MLNRNGEVFTLLEPYPRVGRISREWLIDWEKPLPAEDDYVSEEEVREDPSLKRK